MIYKQFKRKNYVFFFKKIKGQEKTYTSFYIKGKNGIAHTNFIIIEDDKFITLRNRNKKNYEYKTYSLNINKWRMVDNIIERLPDAKI